MNKDKNIKQFLSQITNKNYSDANKALQRVVEDKLKDRIKSSLATKQSSAKK